MVRAPLRWASEDLPWYFLLCSLWVVLVGRSGFCFPALHSQRSRGNLGGKSQKSLPKPSGPKSPKKGRRVPKKTRLRGSLNFSGTCQPSRDFFDTPGRKAQEDFVRLRQGFGPRAPQDSYKWSAEKQSQFVFLSSRSVSISFPLSPRLCLPRLRESCARLRGFLVLELRVQPCNLVA